MRPRLGPVWRMLLLTSLSLPYRASAQTLRTGAPYESVRGPGSIAEHRLEVDGLEHLAEAGSVELVLPEGIVTAERWSVERQTKGVFWRGRVEEAWPVLLTVHDGRLSGLVYTPHATYELAPSPDGLRLAELDGARFPPCATEPSDSDLAPSSGLGGGLLPAMTATAAGIEQPLVIMDALVVYTPQARSGAGGRSRIESVIQSAVNITNTAYANSQVRARLHLIHTEEAPIADSGNASSDLTNVRTSTSVAALRNQYGADLVALIVNRTSACGVGYLQRVPGPGFERLAYQVTARGCAVGNLTFAHEFGHNQGCEHDPANGNDPSRASFPYAFGHFHSGSYRTVMSYSNQCTGGCRRAPFISNSNVSNNGLATGILDQRENYRVINNTSGIVADFRASAGQADFGRATYQVSENQGGIDVSVGRSGLTSVDATIYIVGREDEALEGSDFPPFTSTVTWAAGDTSLKTVRVPIFDDRAVEGPEGFDVVLQEGRGVGAGTRGTARVVIVDYEEGTLRVAPDLPPGVENAPRLEIPVERIGGNQGEVSVEWITIEGTATAGQDYVSAAGVLTWPDGDATDRIIAIDLRDDTAVEGPETFRIQLSNATGGARVEPGAEITLADYEEGELSLALTATTVREDGGSLILPILRDGGVDGDITVGFTVQATPVGSGASAVTDFEVSPRTTTLADGAAEGAIAIRILDDGLMEGDEAFLVTLRSVEGGARLGAALETMVTIQDWEEGRAEFSPMALSVDEDAEAAELRLERRQGSDGPASVTFRSVGGSAEANIDFQQTEGEIRWADGEAGAQTILIPLLDDQAVESDETFVVRVEQVSGVRMSVGEEVSVTIKDREPGAFTFAAVNPAFAETDGTQTLAVRRIDGSAGPVSVRYELVGDTANLGEDVAVGAGMLDFADRVTSAPLPLEILDDERPEGAENFFVRLYDPSGGATVAQELVTVAITDAGSGVFEVTAPPVVSEGDGRLQFSVERTGEAFGPVNITYRAVNGTALSPGDFLSVEETLRWGDGELGAKTAEVALVDDGRDEGDETMVLNFAPDQPTAVLEPGLLIVTLTDNDEGCACGAVSERRHAPWLSVLPMALLVFFRRRRR